jgi:hypothetical protein
VFTFKTRFLFQWMKTLKKLGFTFYSEDEFWYLKS